MARAANQPVGNDAGAACRACCGSAAPAAWKWLLGASGGHAPVPADPGEEALGQAAALQTLRAGKTSVNWTYVSPPAMIGVGGRSRQLPRRRRQLLADGNGVSTITWIDFAVAVVTSWRRMPIRKRGSRWLTQNRKRNETE